MSRRELTAHLAQKTGLPIRQTAQVLRVLVDLVADELTHGGRLEWRSLGTFSVRSYPARKIHVPATGETIELPIRAGVTFKPSKSLLTKLKPKASAKKTVRRPSIRLPTAISPAPLPPVVVAPSKPTKIRKSLAFLGQGYCELCTATWPAGWQPAYEGRGVFRCLGCRQELDAGLRVQLTRPDTRPVSRPSSYVRAEPPMLRKGKTKVP